MIDLLIFRILYGSDGKKARDMTGGLAVCVVLVWRALEEL